MRITNWPQRNTFHDLSDRHYLSGQVLYGELRLPPSGDVAAPAVKTLGPARRPPARGRAKSQLSTAKDVLEKLKKLHPLPGACSVCACV